MSFERRTPEKTVLVFLLLFLAALLLRITQGNPLDLFSFVLMVAAFLFGYRAFYFLPVALFARHAALLFPSPASSQVLFSNFFVLVKWSVIVFITVFALYRYKEVKRYEARVKKDVDMARILQRSLVSRSFEIGSVKVIGYIHQCMQVGGDFYYFRPFKKKYVVLSVGDVMGKGITASFVMAIIMGVFYEWGKKSYLPSGVFEKLNKRLIELWGESAWFATVFYGVLNEETGEFCYASAGHQRALWLKASGDCVYLEAEGLPVGIYRERRWEDYTVRFSPGDRLILFTDGISEARNHAGEMYSYERLEQAASKFRGESLEEIRDGILEDVRRFSGKGFECDDTALVMMEVK